MEIKSSLSLILAVLMCWSAVGSIAAGVRGGGRKISHGADGQRRRMEKASRNETRFEKDAMADILYENRRINKEIAKGRGDHNLVEGDILVHSSNSNSRNKRTVARREGVKWPGAVVPYIVDSAFRDREKRIIFGAMQRFHDESCVKFRKRTIEPDYLFITPGKGCWSMVGRQGGMQKLSLVGTCKVRKGTIMHELMHCLGFRHEHNRPDRDEYIRIMWQNIELGYSENFIEHSNTEVDTMNTRYDYFSIMHYPLSAFSSNGQWTIQPLALYHSYGAVGSRHDFSEQDISRVNQLYNCGACTDQDSLYCPVWAMRGECQRNIAWMAEHCPLSCDTCPDTRGSRRVYVKNCDDSNEQCQHWAERGECSRNPSYMERHCRRSCLLCYVDVTWSQEEQESEEEEVCRDHNSLCPEWAALGECIRSPYMITDCRESCQLCQSNSIINRACQDQEGNCADWAREGLCGTHAAYMLKHCKKSCKVCSTRPNKEARGGRKRLGEVSNEILDETIHRDEDENVAVVNHCTDLHTTCSQWARSNECITNAEWMAINCPNSCGLCGNSGIESACVDRHQNCTLWATEGDCEQFPNWMLDKCPVSCQFCSPKETEQVPLTNIRTVKCKDKKKHCTGWAEAGHCEAYKHWMTVNCPESCDFCGATIDKSCVDKEKKCNLWATKKECRKNKGWFLPNCRFSCNACSEAVPSCVDQHRSCRKKSKKGHCEKKAKIRKECPYSCNLCGN
ncbi:uncharacterized protein [Apostichopus japonicus]|uniref:uncharacterized protein isoform X2 n=1 Tax=Stichopus japonicus TaxID=307972 RepID=UPI003AB689C8